MRIARWSFVLSVLMILWVAEAVAYPIPPQTLRTLTNRSELIVSARVGKITRIREEDRFNKGIAQLKILSIVKGEVGSQSVDVYYWPDVVCPAQPHYEEGAIVLVFLTQLKDSTGYHTVGLSYGAKSLINQEIDIYSARIRELIEIEKQADPNTRQQQLVEWLVRCAEEPATRWEGAYELHNSHVMKMFEMEQKKEEVKDEREIAADGDEMEDRNEETVDLTTLLTEDQKRRLTAALYRASSLSNGGIYLINLAELWGDDNMAPFMWSYLNAYKKDAPWETKTLMHKLATLLKNREALEMVEKFDTGIYTNLIKEDRGEESRKAILQQFIEAIERSGAPRIVEINNEPEPPADSPPHRQNTEGKLGMMAMLLALAVLLIAIPALRS